LFLIKLLFQMNNAPEFLNYIKEQFNRKETSDIQINLYDVNDISHRNCLIHLYLHKLLLRKYEYWDKMLLTTTSSLENNTNIVKLNIIDQFIDIPSIESFFYYCFYSWNKDSKLLNRNLLQFNFLARRFCMSDLESATELALIDSMNEENMCDVTRYIFFNMIDKNSLLFETMVMWIWVLYPYNRSVRNFVNEELSKTQTRFVINVILNQYMMTTEEIKELILSDNISFLSREEKIRMIESLPPMIQKGECTQKFCLWYQKPPTLKTIHFVKNARFSNYIYNLLYKDQFIHLKIRNAPSYDGLLQTMVVIDIFILKRDRSVAKFTFNQIIDIYISTEKHFKIFAGDLFEREFSFEDKSFPLFNPGLQKYVDIIPISIKIKFSEIQQKNKIF